MHSNSNQPWETVNRIIFPTKDIADTISLYALDWKAPHLQTALIDIDEQRRKVDFAHLSTPKLTDILTNSQPSRDGEVTVQDFEVTGRDALTVHTNGHVSLCSYFNAFPAGYWKRWTKVDAIRFTAQAQGAGQISVMRSTGRGIHRLVETIEIDSVDSLQSIYVTIPMTNLMDGGFFWIDASAASTQKLSIQSGEWQAPVAERVLHPSDKQASSFSIAITTFNRPTYCFNQLKSLQGDTRLRQRLDTIYCIDQGTDTVENQPGFSKLQTSFGSQLTYIRQRNLGGSGGFARGMYETAKSEESESVLLLDDDAINEPEAILRAVQFEDYTVSPTIVGAGMLHLDNRSVLYTQGERIDRNTMWMETSQGLSYNHDFSQKSLRDSPLMHQRVDSDFNGWWMCLIPVNIINKIGLPMPVFIKFDDTEYSLRAHEQGFPTVCLPGVAVWHQAWHDKDPARTWEQYFMQRNRWITALLHNPEPNKRFAIEMLRSDLNLGMRLIYSGLALDHRGLRDILRGPDYIVSILGSALETVKELQSNFPDTKSSLSFTDFPEAAEEFSYKIIPRSSRLRQLTGIKSTLKSLITHRDGVHDATPQTHIPAKATTWESFTGLSSALVTSADGNSIAWLRRNTPLFRQALKEGFQLSAYMLKHWKQLSEAYRAYPFTDFETWEQLFRTKGSQ